MIKRKSLINIYWIHIILYLGIIKYINSLFKFVKLYEFGYFVCFGMIIYIFILNVYK